MSGSQAFNAQTEKSRAFSSWQHLKYKKLKKDSIIFLVTIASKSKAFYVLKCTYFLILLTGNYRLMQRAERFCTRHRQLKMHQTH